jgi:hypothetical protein
MTTKEPTLCRYEGVIVVTYYQKVAVDAVSVKDAERAMLDEFDMLKAECDAEVYDMTWTGVSDKEDV